jgi:hypothetical protein
VSRRAYILWMAGGAIAAVAILSASFDWSAGTLAAVAAACGAIAGIIVGMARRSPLLGVAAAPLLALTFVVAVIAIGVSAVAAQLVATATRPWLSFRWAWTIVPAAAGAITGGMVGLFVDSLLRTRLYGTGTK